MGACFWLMGLGSVLVFLGLLNGDITVWHDLAKFGGILLIVVGLVGSAVVAARRKQAERLERIRAGLPQAEAIGRSDGAH